MFHVYCCKAHHHVKSARDAERALVIAREHKCEASDGGSIYGTYITDGQGRIVGNCVDGLTGPASPGAPPYDHATATGMYDRL